MTEPMQPQPQGAAQQGAEQASFQIEKLYVKDLSLEIPNAPQVFMEQVNPQLEVQVGTEIANLAEGLYEVTVTATVTARSGEKTVFLAEAVQAGIFSIRNVAAQELDPLLGIGCPTIVFSLPARDDLGPRHARRLSAGAARPGVVRGPLHAAHAGAIQAGRPDRGRALAARMKRYLLPVLVFSAGFACCRLSQRRRIRRNPL